MVTIPNDPPKPQSANGKSHDPPYPLSPKKESQRPIVSTAATGETAGSVNPNSDSEDDWEKDDSDEEWQIEDKPPLPPALRAGPPPGTVANIKSCVPIDNPGEQAYASQISLPVSVTTNAASSNYSSQLSIPTLQAPPPPLATPPHTQTNPFLQKQNTGERIFGVDTTPNWQSKRPVQVTYDDGAQGPVELPAVETPTRHIQALDPSRQSLHSTQPPLIPVDTDCVPPRATTPVSTLGPQVLAQALPIPKAQEHYAIKQIKWYDARCGRLRDSPILLQNANGPCPLMALVNALILASPESSTGGLAQTLQSREQISLDLLLQSVFDELTSTTSTSTGQLPDVGELYGFLQKLHTGMNVNPRFTFAPDRASREIHPAHRPTLAPGGFEETREMSLYGTFDIPLVHGWLPPRDSSVYQSFLRSAKTYEDAQNLQFHEEELEHKLASLGLTKEEEVLFHDLTAIKSFLYNWPTQVTDYGLQILHEHLLPGSFYIFFRNDHFSTLYKEPKADQLFTLVTDAGYATHDEIIWESLVDVSGNQTELFSGDFRPVSQANPPNPQAIAPAGPRGSSLTNSQTIQSMLDVGDDSQWSTVQGNNRPRLAPLPNDQSVPSPSQNQFQIFDQVNHTSSTITPSEQEDHDLALAMQLQEEEDARARRENEARQRDNVFEGQGRVHDPRTTISISGPVAPSRLPQSARPAIPPRRNRDEDIPPPTYEQAASRPAFVPPRNHPSNPSAPLPNTNPQSHSHSFQPPGWGRGSQAGFGGGRMHSREDRDKCHVM